MGAFSLIVVINLLNRCLMGRTKDKIWDHYEELKVDGNIRARCRKCSHEMVNNAERMRGHWKFCSKRASTFVSDEATQPKQRCLTQTTLNVATECFMFLTFLT